MVGTVTIMMTVFRIGFYEQQAPNVSCELWFKHLMLLVTTEVGSPREKLLLLFSRKQLVVVRR